jgi:hypothetical protein
MRNLIGGEVEKPHGLVFHRIRQATAVDKPPFLRVNRFPEFRQLFWRHGEVGIQSLEHRRTRRRSRRRSHQPFPCQADVTP